MYSYSTSLDPGGSESELWWFPLRSGDGTVSSEYEVMWDDVEAVRFLLGLGHMLLCGGDTETAKVCRFMYSYSSSSASSSRLDERDLAILPRAAREEHSRVSGGERGREEVKRSFSVQPAILQPFGMEFNTQ